MKGRTLNKCFNNNPFSKVQEAFQHGADTCNTINPSY